MPFLDRGPVRIRYEVIGTGPAVVLHTGAGGDSRLWQDAGYVKGLAGFRLILMDHRGRGHAADPTGSRTTGWSASSRTSMYSSTRSGWTRRDSGDTLMAPVPRGQVVHLPGLGHLGAFYRSDLALSHARPFLERNLGEG